jgi:hypothetical protein
VAKSLLNIGCNSTSPLPTSLLSFSLDESSVVRKALVSLLKRNPHLDYLPTLVRLAEDQWSASSYNYGDNDEFPIARSAIDVVMSMEFTNAEAIEKLYQIALNTSDRILRRKLFSVVVVRGGLELQERLLELAVRPGRSAVVYDASKAILTERNSLDSRIVNKITTYLLSNCAPLIAVEFTLIAACRLSMEDLLHIARVIAANAERRVLVLLMLWPRLQLDGVTKSYIEALLPEQHRSLLWISTGPSMLGDDALISDLGDADVCEAVLAYLNSAVIKST